MKKSTLCDLNYANAKKYSYKAYTGTVAYIPYLYDTEVNEDGSVLSGKIGIEYVDAPNIFPSDPGRTEKFQSVFLLLVEQARQNLPEQNQVME